MKIIIHENGPFEVKGSFTISRRSIIKENNTLVEKLLNELDKTSSYLCRCGVSNIKPFCDGTHKLMRFKGESLINNSNFNDNTKLYRNSTIELEDNKHCARALFCHSECGKI